MRHAGIECYTGPHPEEAKIRWFSSENAALKWRVGYPVFLFSTRAGDVEKDRMVCYIEDGYRTNNNEVRKIMKIYGSTYNDALKRRLLLDAVMVV